MEEYFDEILLLTMDYAPMLILSVIVLVVGLWLIGVFTNITSSVMKKS